MVARKAPIIPMRKDSQTSTTAQPAEKQRTSKLLDDLNRVTRFGEFSPLG
jgi:hypothetical protein